MSEWLEEQRIVTLAADGQEAIAFEAHQAIYDGIAARDPDRAEAAMRRHLEQLAATFWRLRGTESPP
jgi:GntR family transcriptional repressor for pyruvate dehydrogenase complex